MNSITLSAPAKVNIFLKVLNKRKDGYHNILTLFERISLADKIIISKIPQGIVIGYDPQEDKKRFYISESGIVIVAKGTEIK